MKGIAYRNRNEGKLDTNGNARKPNWVYRFEGASVGGKRQFFEKGGFATKREAILAGTKAFQQYNSCGSVFQDTAMSYSDCLDSWLEDYVSVRCLPLTKQSYEKRLDLYVRPVLGKYKLTSLRRENIQNLINNMFKEHFSRNSLTNTMALISSSLRYARRQGWIEINPAEDIDLPTSRQCVDNRKNVREVIPRYVMDKILERFPEGHPERIGIMLAYHCGLRLGEAYGLIWDDVDLIWGSIYLQRQVQWDAKNHVYVIVPPKYDSNRRIKMDNEIWEFLKREKKRQEQGRLEAGDKYEQLFIDEHRRLNTDRRGEPIYMVNTRPDGTYIQPRVTQHAAHIIKTELGYSKFDFHSLRHTHATELCEAGVNIKEIQRRLGHSTMEVTSKRYLHATELMEEQSVELMNEMHGCSDNQPRDDRWHGFRIVR